MSLTLNRSLAVFATLSALTLFAVDASASLRVRCESRSDRSKASVDGNDLAPGVYSARIESGPNTKDSKKAKHTNGDEVEFDFDSNTGERGATRIDKDFIVDGMLTGSLLDDAGNVVASKTVNCRRR